MTRSCARPGCNQSAAATLSYDYAGRTAWLHRLSDEPHPMTHDLCERHAGTLIGAPGLAARRPPHHRPALPARHRQLSELEPPAERERRWGLGDVAIGLIPLYLGVLAVIVLWTNPPEDGATAETTPALLLGSSLFLWAFFLAVPLVSTRRKGNGPVADLGLRARPSDLPIGFGIGILAQIVLVWLIYLPLSWLIDTDEVSSDARDLTDNFSGGAIFILVFVVVIGAPIVEEIFFRGLVYRAIEKRNGPTWALWASALLFAVSHTQLIQFPALLMFGLLAGRIVQRTDRLGLAIAAHMGFNAWTVFALLALNW